MALWQAVFVLISPVQRQKSRWVPKAPCSILHGQGKTQISKAVSMNSTGFITALQGGRVHKVKRANRRHDINTSLSTIPITSLKKKNVTFVPYFPMPLHRSNKIKNNLWSKPVVKKVSEVWGFFLFGSSPF